MQELLGGKFGEMSTLMSYTFQSFNFRGRTEMRPFYDLIADIATEEFGHIELSYAINLLLTGSTKRGAARSGHRFGDVRGHREKIVRPGRWLRPGRRSLPAGLRRSRRAGTMDARGSPSTGAVGRQR